MDKACANKVLEVFKTPEEVERVVFCVEEEMLQHIFDTTRGLPDRDFLIAVLIEDAGSPRCVYCTSAFFITFLALDIWLAMSKSWKHSREDCLCPVLSRYSEVIVFTLAALVPVPSLRHKYGVELGNMPYLRIHQAESSL